MSGIEGGGESGPVLTSYGLGYGILYGGIFLLFLAVVAMGFKHGGNGVASVIASALLWVLYSAYPIPPDRNKS